MVALPLHYYIKNTAGKNMSLKLSNILLTFFLFKNKYLLICINLNVRYFSFDTFKLMIWSFQAVNRQISLEQQLQTLKENEQALQALQESLSQLDHTLTSYLTDRIDAFRLPQEAQVQPNTLSHPVEIQNENMLHKPSEVCTYSIKKMAIKGVFVSA